MSELRDCDCCEQGKHQVCREEVLHSYSLGPGSDGSDLIEDIWIPCPCLEREHTKLMEFVPYEGE